MSNNTLINFIKNYKSTITILLSVFLGISTGLVMGKQAEIFLPFGTIFINLIFTIVTPLIFFSISSSIANIVTLNSTKRTIVSSIFVFLLMSFVASVIMIFLVKFFPIVEKATIPLTEIVKIDKINILEKISAIFTVSDFNKILTKDAILPLMIFSILFGLSVKLSGDKANSVKKSLNDCSVVMYKMINFLMYYAPIGLFAYFAWFFGSSSEQLVGPIARMIALFYLICFVFCITVYPLFAYISSGYEGIKALKFLLVPAVTAFATRSSLATVPADFEAVNNMNVPKSVSNLSIPFGSILFFDGSTLFTILEMAFLFCMFDMPLTGANFYLSAFLFSIFACILSAGIPTGGMVVEILMITIFNFPIETLPILILLNFLADPIITLVNSTGNIIATMIISRIIKGKGWIFRKEIEEDLVLKIYR